MVIVCPPTESTLTAYILPQISQSSQNFLLSVFSHRFHRFAQMVRAHPLKLHLCNLWEVIPSRRFCEFCSICGRIFRTQTICVDLCSLWEVIPSKQKQSVGASSQPPFLAPLQTLRVIPCGARRVGRQGTDRKQTGAGGEYSALLH